MTPSEIGIIGFLVLIIFLFSGMPIGVVMGLVGFVGFAVLRGFETALGVLTTVPYSTFASYSFSCIPLFILMGELFYYAELNKDLFKSAYCWLGNLRGGLAMATIGGCAGFAALCGSSMATAVTMGTVSLPEMKRYNYGDALATGCVAAGGTIGILIPPSVILIVYGIITEQSIGKLFLAGLIPGILQALLFMATIYILCTFNKRLGPPGPKTDFITKIASLKNSWIVLLLCAVILGGLYLGVFTPTEAGGIGAFGAFLFALARRRLTLRNFIDSLVATSKTTAMLFLILLGAMFLGYFLAVSKLPNQLADFIAGIAVNRYIIFVLIILLYLFLGCLMDSLAMILLTVPVFYPLIIALGFDPIWFGIIIVVVVEIGLITPPVGLNVFVIKGIASDVSMYTIFKGIIPFIMADIIMIGILVAFPEIILFLPHLMK